MGFLLRVSDVNQATTAAFRSGVSAGSVAVEIETLNLPSSPVKLQVQCEYESNGEDGDDVIKKEQHGNRDEKKKRKRGGCDDREPAVIKPKTTLCSPGANITCDEPSSSVFRESDIISDSDDDDSESMRSSDDSSSDSSDDEDNGKLEDEILSLQGKNPEEKSPSPPSHKQVPLPQGTLLKVPPPPLRRGILKHHQKQRNCVSKNTKRARIQLQERKTVVFGNESTTTKYYPSTVTKAELKDKKTQLWCTKQDRMNSLQEVIDLMKIFRNENKVEIQKWVDLYRMLGGGGMDDVSPFLTKQTSDYLEHVNVTIPSLIRGMESRISPRFTSERRKNHIRNVLSLSNIHNLDAKERFVSNRSIQSSRSSRIVARMIGEGDAKMKDITTIETFTPELVTVSVGGDNSTTSVGGVGAFGVPPPPPLPPTPILTSKKKRKIIAKKAQNNKKKWMKKTKVLFPSQKQNHQPPEKNNLVQISKRNTRTLPTRSLCSSSSFSYGVAAASKASASTNSVTPPLRTNFGHARRRRIPLRPKKGNVITGMA